MPVDGQPGGSVGYVRYCGTDSLSFSAASATD